MSIDHLQLRSAACDNAPVRVLIVDDDEAVGRVIGRCLRATRYQPDTAVNGSEALEMLRRTRYDAVLCDVHMPGMNGIEVLRHAQRIDAELPVIMLTGVNDASVATTALAHGAADYIMKPPAPQQIERALDRALREREVRSEEQRIARMIRREVDLRTAESERELQGMRGQTVSVVEALVNAIEAKDPHLRGHSHRVAELAASTAVELGLDEDEVEQVRIAARLHEVGKIGIHESVLAKSGALTPDEYAHVQEYVRIGVEILAPMRFLGGALRIVEEHQERWNGTGYPRQLAGEAIALGARILAVADTYDAIISTRPHREPMTEGEALEYLARLSGTTLDARVCHAFRSVIERRKALAFLDLHSHDAVYAGAYLQAS